MPIHNRTKIVATLGPASRDDTTLAQLVKAGVDVFRLNAAHSDHATIARDVRAVRRAAKTQRRGLGVMVDLQGPKMRVGPFVHGEPIWLQRGQKLVISTDPSIVGATGTDGQPTRIGCSYEGLARDAKRGEHILLDDGNIELKVERIDGSEILTTVVYGGLLKQYKGVNLPRTRVSAPSITEKDLADLQAALKAEVDYVALSFVRSADDVRQLRRHIAAANSDTQVIAKIERPEAVKNLDDIVTVADGLMVARGDMGVELGPQAVPALQKRIIRLAVEARKPVITATQMLESMITNPRPTRAEASDVANAIYDGTSAVMLSAETATGKFAVRAVKTMDEIITSTEKDIFSNWEYTRRRSGRSKGSPVPMATVRAAAYAALEAEAKLIAVFTESGNTARIMAGERTPSRIVAFTPFQRTVQRLALVWGITALRVSRTRTSHEMTLDGERILLESGLARKGDRIVVVFGTTRASGLTNIMNIRTLGDEPPDAIDRAPGTGTRRSGGAAGADNRAQGHGSRRSDRVRARRGAEEPVAGADGHARSDVGAGSQHEGAAPTAGGAPKGDRRVRARGTGDASGLTSRGGRRRVSDATS